MKTLTKLLLLASASLLISIISVVIPDNQSKVMALSGGDFNPGRIIDDSVFYNSSSMTAPQIQAFLNGKVTTCDTNGTQPASDWGRPDITHAQLAEYIRNGSNGYTQNTSFHAPPYTCLRDRRQNTPQMEAASGLCAGLSAQTNQSAAEIIYDVATACGINPQVLIVLLEKEQSLVTDRWPLDGQYNKATGFDCPDSAPCDPQYAGFFYQTYYAARQFKVYQAFPTSYNYIAGRTNRIYWQTNLGGFINPTGNENDLSRNGQSACGYSNVYIENQATAALYIYTPYRPNQAALGNLYGRGDGCSAYGNRNFWRIFSDWFGSTIGTTLNGIDYSAVFNTEYYLDYNSDLKAALSLSNAFSHFIKYGINEGRIASSEFNVTSYRNRYVDLRWQYGTDLSKYYLHYILFGKSEGRIGTGNVQFNPVTIYNGIDYSLVYNFDYYTKNNADIFKTFGLDDTATLKHFVTYGMKEGRIASSTFNVSSYRNANQDLRNAYGNDLAKYYLHYIKWGHDEGRVTIGDYRGGVSRLNGIDYSLVYNFDYYTKNNADIFKTFGLDDTATLKHFVTYGMKEGRIASSTFNVSSYRNANQDLRNAYGNDLAKYYLHYIKWGHDEGRTI